jgi:hypothetical protein
MVWLSCRHYLPVPVLLATVTPASGQIDYRNLDRGRPVRVSDANVVERFAFELAVPYQVSWGGSGSAHLISPHLEHGIARNLMIGVGAEVVARRTGGFDAASRATIGALWNARRETPGAPAFSVGVEAELPLRSGESPGAGLMVLATRSVGRARVHGNLVTTVAVGERTGNRARVGWWTGIAADYTLVRTSTVVAAELTVEQRYTGERLGWGLGVGARRQVTPTIVLHLGGSRGLHSGGGFDLRLGLSHAFAIAGLMPGRPR